MHTDPPPLAPEDQPLDEGNRPVTRSPWWIALAVIIVLALIAGLAYPIIADWY